MITLNVNGIEYDNFLSFEVSKSMVNFSNEESENSLYLLTNFSNKFEGINPVQFCAEAAILPTVNYSAYVIVKYFVNSTDTNKA